MPFGFLCWLIEWIFVDYFEFVLFFPDCWIIWKMVWRVNSVRVWISPKNIRNIMALIQCKVNSEPCLFVFHAITFRSFAILAFWLEIFGFSISGSLRIFSAAFFNQFIARKIDFITRLLINFLPNGLKQRVS